jgi:hypothetical protein
MHLHLLLLLLCLLPLATRSQSSLPCSQLYAGLYCCAVPPLAAAQPLNCSRSSRTALLPCYARANVSCGGRWYNASLAGVNQTAPDAVLCDGVSYSQEQMIFRVVCFWGVDVEG